MAGPTTSIYYGRFRPYGIGSVAAGGAGTLGAGSILRTIGAPPLISTKGEAEPGYPPIPSLIDPGIWAAGTAARRRAQSSSGQPQGLLWQTAAWPSWMPGVIGR